MIPSFLEILDDCGENNRHSVPPTRSKADLIHIFHDYTFQLFSCRVFSL